MRRWRGLTGRDAETAVIFGTYHYKRPRSLMGYTRTRQWGTSSSQTTLQSGTRAGVGGHRLLLPRPPAPPLTSRILPVARADRGKLPSDIRRPAMVYFLAEL